jgi:DNA-binding PadR family transcriptional regulator
MMTEKRKVANPLALAVLSYLSREPMHPYELVRTLRRNGDERSVKFNPGSLYMVIRQLAKAGFIVESETTRDGNRPERTVYALSAAGREEWRDWLRELVEEPHYEYPQFVLALSLIAALPPNDVVDLLSTRLRRVAEQRAETRELIDRTIAMGVPPLFLVDEEYRVAMLETEATFIEGFIDRINHPETGWGPPWAEFLAQTAIDDEREQ